MCPLLAHGNANTTVLAHCKEAANATASSTLVTLGLMPGTTSLPWGLCFSAVIIWAWMQWSRVRSSKIHQVEVFSLTKPSQQTSSANKLLHYNINRCSMLMSSDQQFAAQTCKARRNWTWGSSPANATVAPSVETRVPQQHLHCPLWQFSTAIFIPLAGSDSQWLVFHIIHIHDSWYLHWSLIVVYAGILNHARSIFVHSGILEPESTHVILFCWLTYELIEALWFMILQFISTPPHLHTSQQSEAVPLWRQCPLWDKSSGPRQKISGSGRFTSDCNCQTNWTRSERMQKLSTRSFTIYNSLT